MVKAALGAQSLRGAACRAGKHHPPQGSAQQAGLLAAGRAGAELQSPRPGQSPRKWHQQCTREEGRRGHWKQLFLEEQRQWRRHWGAPPPRDQQAKSRLLWLQGTQ